LPPSRRKAELREPAEIAFADLTDDGMVRHPDQVLAAGLLHCGRLCQSGKVRRIDDAMPATVLERMDGHLMEAVVDAYGAVHDCRAHHLADQPPWHRVGIASGAISREQFAAEMPRSARRSKKSCKN
jgi:hypothetical protein